MAKYFVLFLIFLTAGCGEISDWSSEKKYASNEALSIFYSNEIKHDLGLLTFQNMFDRILEENISLKIIQLESNLKSKQILMEQNLGFQLNQTISGQNTLGANNLKLSFNVVDFPFLHLNYLANKNQKEFGKAKKRLAKWELFKETFRLYYLAAVSKKLTYKYENLQLASNDLLRKIRNNSIVFKTKNEKIISRKKIAILDGKLSDRLIAMKKYTLILKTKAKLNSNRTFHLEKIQHILPILDPKYLNILDKLALENNEEISKSIHKNSINKWNKVYNKIAEDLPSIRFESKTLSTLGKPFSLTTFLKNLFELSWFATFDILKIIQWSHYDDYLDLQNEISQKKITNLMIQSLLKNRIFLTKYIYSLHKYSSQLDLHYANSYLLKNQSISHEEEKTPLLKLLMTEFDQLESEFLYTQSYINIWENIIDLLKILNLSYFDDKTDHSIKALFEFLEDRLYVGYMSDKKYLNLEINPELLIKNKSNSIFENIQQTWNELEKEQNVILEVKN